MKKKFNEDIKVYCEEHFDQLPKLPFLEYPYDRELLNLIKENNLFNYNSTNYNSIICHICLLSKHIRKTKYKR